MDDAFFMQLALTEAAKAAALGEVPIGAVLVRDGAALAQDHNRTEALCDATAHAEVLVMRAGGRLLGGWRLPATTLYVTIEPCPMCAGALVQARVKRLVYGASDPKAWADRNLREIVQNPGLNHRVEVTGGVLAAEAAALMRQFFRDRRRRPNTNGHDSSRRDG